MCRSNPQRHSRPEPVVRASVLSLQIALRPRPQLPFFTTSPLQLQPQLQLRRLLRDRARGAARVPRGALSRAARVRLAHAGRWGARLAGRHVLVCGGGDRDRHSGHDVPPQALPPAPANWRNCRQLYRYHK